MPSYLRLPALCLLALFAFVLSASPAAASRPADCLPFEASDFCPVLGEQSKQAKAVAKGQARKARVRTGLRALRAARTYLGVPYAWGGEGRGGLDCSGLVVVSFRHAGRKLPHYSGALWALGRKIPRKALLPGDLVFFRLSGGVPGHVGIYAGRGRYIHAPSSGGRVRYGLMSDRNDDYAGARRLR